MAQSAANTVQHPHSWDSHMIAKKVSTHFQLLGKKKALLRLQEYLYEKESNPMRNWALNNTLNGQHGSVPWEQ